MRKVLLSAIVFLAMPAMAIDFGQIIDLGRKAVDQRSNLETATRDFTVDEEVQLGEGITAGFLGASPLDADSNLQRYVNRVGKWVAMHSERPDLPWTFGVIDTPTINAFAMPGGSVLISRGLLDRLGSESELAAVLGHEIAHVVKKHQLSAIQKGAGANFFAEVGKDELARRTGSSRYAIVATPLGAKGVDLLKDGLYLRPLDKSMEYEADRLGVVIAARSGYDPYGLVAVLQSLALVKPEESGLSIMFSTHPPPADRLAELEKFSPVLDRYASQPQVEARFRQVTGAR